MRERTIYHRACAVKMTREFKRAVTEAARRDDRSITNWIARAASKWLGRVGECRRPGWGGVNTETILTVELPGDLVDLIQVRYGSGNMMEFIRTAIRHELRAVSASSAARS